MILSRLDTNMLNMKKQNILALLLGLFVLGGILFPGQAKGQINSLSSTLVCPGDSILAFGEGFASTDSITVDGVRAWFTCAVDNDNCAGTGDTMLIIIPFGPNYGSSATLQRYENGPQGSFLLTVCQGMVPDTACHEDTVKIFEDFSGVNAPDSIIVGGVTLYASSGVPAFPDIVVDSMALVFIDPTVPQGQNVTVEVISNAGADHTYTLYVKYTDGASFDYGTTHICSDSTGVFPVTPPLAPGTFSSIPSGIIVNSTTGEINPNLASAPYNYIIRYDVDPEYSCNLQYQTSLYVAPSPTAGFSYPDSILCSNDTARIPSIDNMGGNFNAAGLSPTFLNSSTGEIPSNAPIGLYDITYTHFGGTQCAQADTFQMRISETPTTFFSYNTACFGSTNDPVPILGGGFTLGGTFTDVSTLLTMDQNNGIVTISAVPNPAPYTITYSIDTNSCFASHSTILTIDPPGNSSIQYPLGEYCLDSGQVAVPQLGSNGGTFTINPFIFGDSITIDSLGEVDLTPGATDTGRYEIIYTVAPPAVTCENSDTTYINVVEAPDPSFSFLNSVYCQLDPDPQPFFVAAPGGIFEELTGNVDIDSSDGTIDLSQSQAGGPYVIQYTVQAGTCIETGYFNVTVVDSFDARFIYSGGSSICLNSTNPVPTILGDGGGRFSTDDSLSLVLNDSTGMIYLDSSTAGGPYKVYYDVGLGACAGRDSFIVAIIPPTTATIEYSNPILCTDSGNPLPTLSGATGGTFYDPLNLVQFNGSNGTINVNTSTVGGPYLVYYDPPGTCIETAVDTVTIMVPAPASFYYTDSAYCPSDNDPVPVMTGIGGGTWTAGDSVSWVIPGGVDIGRVDLDQSGDDTTHVIYYQSPGACPSIDSNTIVIRPKGNASFVYPNQPYCTSDTIPRLPNRTDTTGIFASLTPGIVIDDSTGLIVIDSTLPGTYTIRYNVGGDSTGCEATSFATVEIGLADTSVITYDTVGTLPPHFCQNGDDPFPKLTGSPGGTYISPDTNVVFVNDVTGQVDVSATGPSNDPYIITYSVGNNCAGLEASTTIFIDPVDTADFFFENAAGVLATEFCASDSNPNAVAQSMGGIFVKVPDSANVVIDPTNGEVFLNLSPTGSYLIQYQTLDTASGCRDTSEVKIDINPDPGVNLVTNLKDSIICDGSVVKLTALGGNPLADCFYFEVFNDSSLGWQQFQTKCGIIDGNVLDTTGVPLGLNQLRITVENSFGCTAAESLFVRVNPIPRGRLLELDSVISGRETVLARVEALTDSTRFAWNLKGIGDVIPAFESGFTDPLNTNEIATIQTTRVQTTDSRRPSEIRVSLYPTREGCIGEVFSDTLRIIPNGENFFIPEIMTPNGNNQNDYWVIQWNQDINPRDYYLQVFNRMGGLVKTLESLDQIWYGGTLPDGVYWWVLRKYEDKSAVKKGGLKILREE